MRRELWAIGRMFGHAVGILNSIFCQAEEKELNEEEKWLVVEQINSMCSKMMIEDATDILGMVSAIPTQRLCERTDCHYHHPENFQRHDYTTFQDKCDECLHNEKCKLDENMKMEHFETI